MGQGTRCAVGPSRAGRERKNLRVTEHKGERNRDPEYMDRSLLYRRQVSKVMERMEENKGAGSRWNCGKRREAS